MKKEYMIPVQRVVNLDAASHMMTGSGSKDKFEVGLSDDDLNGADALSEKKDLWGNENVWK